jgi:putative ABC transport system ATP-binding protein
VAVTAGGGTGTPAIEASSLYRFFRAGDEETLALRGASVRACPGELVAVAGPSGSGKSTLLSCLAGLDEPDGGTVRVQGDRMSHRPEPVRARLRAGRIGILTQSADLFGHLSVRANLAFVRSLAVRRVRRPPADLLDSVGLTRRADSYPGELSGGELARAGLVMALANDPSVLLADEPTGELNRVAEADVIGLLRAERERGVAVVLASHSTQVLDAADRVVRLRDGLVVP